MAEQAGATTMVPFTYRFMPTNQWVKQLIDDGHLGRPFHLDLRYFTGFALDGEYAWRFRSRPGRAAGCWATSAPTGSTSPAGSSAT